MRKITISLLTISAVAFVLFTAATVWAASWCGSATFQEGNPLPFIRAMQQMEAQNTDIVVVQRTPTTWLMRAPHTLPQQDALTHILERKGWRFADQMGGDHIYRRGDVYLHVHCRMFTSRYQSCMLDPQSPAP